MRLHCFGGGVAVRGSLLRVRLKGQARRGTLMAIAVFSYSPANILKAVRLLGKQGENPDSLYFRVGKSGL